MFGAAETKILESGVQYQFIYKIKLKDNAPLPLGADIHADIADVVVDGRILDVTRSWNIFDPSYSITFIPDDNVNLDTAIPEIASALEYALRDRRKLESVIFSGVQGVMKREELKINLTPSPSTSKDISLSSKTENIWKDYWPIFIVGFAMLILLKRR